MAFMQISFQQDGVASINAQDADSQRNQLETGVIEMFRQEFSLLNTTDTLQLCKADAEGRLSYRGFPTLTLVKQGHTEQIFCGCERSQATIDHEEMVVIIV